MNNPFVHEQSTALAERILNSGSEDSGRIRYAVELVWSRPALSGEVESAHRYLDRFAVEAERAGLSAEQSRWEAWASYARVLLSANEFFFVD